MSRKIRSCNDPGSYCGGGYKYCMKTGLISHIFHAVFKN
jgi:hypothetical protein